MKMNQKTQKNLLVSSVLLLVLFIMMTGVFAGKHADRGYLGISIEKISIDEKKETGLSYGLIVTDVTKGESKWVCCPR